MSLDRHVNFICKQIYCYATSGIALMMSSAHYFSHIVLICIVVSYGLTLQKKNVQSSLNSVLRRLLCILKPYSASNMFVSGGIPSFAELLRKSIYRFKNRIELSSNSIITACLSPLIYVSSPIRKWWISVHYMN